MTNHTTVLSPVYVEALKETGADWRKPVLLEKVGQVRLRELLKRLRAQEDYFSNLIKTAYRRLEIFDKKTADDFDHLAETSIDLATLSPGIEPEPTYRIGHSSIGGDSGTYVRCGACSKGVWSNRRISCTLQYPEHLKKDADGLLAPESHCALRTYDKYGFAAMSRRFRKHIETLKIHRRIIRKHIAYLTDMIDPSFEAPNLPVGEFGESALKLSYGDRVRVFIHSACCRQKSRFTWQPATVLRKDGDFVVVCFDYPIMTSRTKVSQSASIPHLWKKHVWWNQQTKHTVLLEDDFWMLRELYLDDPEDETLQTWQKLLDYDLRFYDDLSQEYADVHGLEIYQAFAKHTPVEEAELKDRLMSWREACMLLQLSSLTLTPDTIVQAFRKQAKGADPELTRLLDRAKNTLLMHHKT